MRPIDADAIAPKLEGKFNQDMVRYAPTIDPATLAPRWRNAKTDPPKEDGEYLVYMSSGRYMLLRWNNKGHIWTGNGLNYTKQKTEWWAELPQSPKRG